jgi:hypothetical protein
MFFDGMWVATTRPPTAVQSGSAVVMAEVVFGIGVTIFWVAVVNVEGGFVGARVPTVIVSEGVVYSREQPPRIKSSVSSRRPELCCDVVIRLRAILVFISNIDD